MTWRVIMCLTPVCMVVYGCERDPGKPVSHYWCQHDAAGVCECNTTDNPYSFGTCGRADCCWSDYAVLPGATENHANLRTCYCVPINPMTGECPPPRRPQFNKPKATCP
jgi:hypothetical protein